MGAGYYLIAFTIVILMLCTMLGLQSLKKKLRVSGTIYDVKLEADKSIQIQTVFEKLIAESAHINNLKIEEVDGRTYILLKIKIPRNVNIEDLMHELCDCCIVREFTVV